jgi:hypothetical protein
MIVVRDYGVNIFNSGLFNFAVYLVFRDILVQSTLVVSQLLLDY